MSSDVQVFDTPHAIGLYRLTALKHMCKMEAKGMKMSRGQNACASARKEFKIKGRSRQQVVDWLTAYIHKIKTDPSIVIDCYGHIQESPNP